MKLLPVSTGLGGWHEWRCMICGDKGIGEPPPIHEARECLPHSANASDGPWAVVGERAVTAGEIMTDVQAAPTTFRPPFIVRPGTASDVGFIADAWVQSYRASSRATKMSDKAAFFTHHHRAVERLLKRSEIRIAAPPGDDLTIYAFAVLEHGPVEWVHFVYTKKPWRRLGLARALLAGCDVNAVTCSYWSRDFGDWIREKYRGIKYNPYISEVL